MKHLGFFLREACGNIRHGGILTAASLVAMSLASVVTAFVGITYYNLRAIYKEAKAEVYLDVYLKDDVPEERAAALGNHIRRLPGVRSLRFISSKEALEEFVGLFPEDKELLAAAGPNPLPASYRVYLTEEANGAAAVNELAKKVAAMDGVEDVVYGSEWLGELERWAQTVAVAGGVVAAILGVAAVSVVMSTVAVTVYARRDVINIMKIIGATDGFVAMPFLVQGFLIGTASGVLALAGSYGVCAALTGWGLDIRTPPPPCAFAAVAGAALLGVVGSAVAVRRVLRP